jgi:two-component system nitrogen regulation response regulator GlnG
MPLHRVLVADDDEAIRTLLIAVLKRQGFTVDLVRNGKEAIDQFAAQKYDVLLLDLMMPIMNGFEVIDYLERTAPEDLNRKVVVLTAASKRDRAKIQGDLVYRIVEKPFDMNELVSIIRSCVDD